MSNAFIQTKELFSEKERKFTGTVTNKNGLFLKILTDTGVYFDATGNFNIGDYVYVKGSLVLGAIKRENTPIVIVN